MTITVDDIRERVAKIADLRGDDEVAHIEEDRLRRDVLLAIAGGAPNAPRLAFEALKTTDIEFARWCA